MSVGSAWEVIQGVYLLLSLFHIFVTSLAYVTALLDVLVNRPKRLLPSLIAAAIVTIIIVFFWNIFVNLSIPDLFNGYRWPSDFFQRWPIYFVIDPVLLLFVIWFKLACSIDAIRFIPTNSEVERFRDEYESVKGHRDLVVIYCLRGDEPQEDSLASIRTTINSKFPAHRLRVLLLFYGEPSSILDRYLRTHLSPEPLDPTLEHAPIENLVASNGVKISILRISVTSSKKANLRCLDFLAMAYEEDKLRKPTVCFLSCNIILDEMAIARFVYELDDPHREFVTGVRLQSENDFFVNKVLTSMPFWSQIQTRIAEDYCGNITQMPADFFVARFKALKAIADEAYIESDSSEFMQNHHLTMCLIKAKSTRHRLGICLGALARPASSPALEPFVKQIKKHAIKVSEQFVHNSEIILDPHVLTATPLLSLIVAGSSLFECHIHLFIQLFLLERTSGRGNAFASSYVFLLLLPSYLFSVFVAFRYGETPAALTIFCNFLLKPLMDTVTDLMICYLIAQKHIWERFVTKKQSIDAKGIEELTSAQAIV